MKIFFMSHDCMFNNLLTIRKKSLTPSFQLMVLPGPNDKGSALWLNLKEGTSVFKRSIRSINLSSLKSEVLSKIISKFFVFIKNNLSLFKIYGFINYQQTIFKIMIDNFFSI